MKLQLAVLMGMVLAGALAGCGKSAEYDIVIRNGLIYDGSGRDPFVADLAIKDDRIAAIGKELGSGALTVEANGLYVAPGFIDPHNHAEFSVDAPERYPVLNYLRQAMQEGAVGLSSGLYYTPGKYATTEEVIELARGAGRAGDEMTCVVSCPVS